MSMSVLIACLMCVALTQASRIVHARFGNQVVYSDYEFGIDFVLVKVQRPVNAPSNFRETENLHIFPSQFVAMRNSQDKHCYLRRFVESEDRLRGRVETAEFNDGEMANVYEEELDVDFLETISNKAARALVGKRIADFCIDHTIFVLTPDHFRNLTPEEVEGERIQKRAAGSLVVANDCESNSRTGGYGGNRMV